jgi:hypothetical protein
MQHNMETSGFDQEKLETELELQNRTGTHVAESGEKCAGWHSSELSTQQLIAEGDQAVAVAGFTGRNSSSGGSREIMESGGARAATATNSLGLDGKEHHDGEEGTEFKRAESFFAVSGNDGSFQPSLGMKLLDTSSTKSDLGGREVIGMEASKLTTTTVMVWRWEITFLAPEWWMV